MFRCYYNRSDWFQLSRRKRKSILRGWNYYDNLYTTTYIRTYKKFMKDLHMTEWPNE